MDENKRDVYGAVAVSAMAERHVGSVEDGVICTPPNIQPNVTAVMCRNNNDINEETQCGHGSTHCTIGIIIRIPVQPGGAAASGSRAQTTSTRGD